VLVVHGKGTWLTSSGVLSSLSRLSGRGLG
jgi:hypothetical protein